MPCIAPRDGQLLPKEPLTIPSQNKEIKLMERTSEDQQRTGYAVGSFGVRHHPEMGAG